MKIFKHILSTTLILIIISILSFNSNGQSVGISNNAGYTVNGNAILDMDDAAGTKGVLIPRMTTAESVTFGATLAAADDGLMIYDTNIKLFKYWNGASSAWVPIGVGTGFASTLDQAYDGLSGAGSGKVIVADAGAVDIQGPGGLIVNGNLGIGGTGADKLHVQTTGANTTMRIGYSPSYFNNLLYFGEGTDVYVGEKNLDDRLYLFGRGLSIDINGDLGTAGNVLKSNGTTVTWQPDLGVTGTGTLNYLARWTSASTLGIGATFDNGTNVGIGNTNPGHKLSVGDATSDGQSVTIRGYSNTPGSWKGGGAFGYSSAAVIMGELSGIAQLGGHNGTLTAWADLAINSGGGNVGIGTSTPDAKLNVGDPNGATIYLTREAGTINANDMLGSILFDGTAQTSPSTVDASAVIRAFAAQAIGNSNKGGYLTFMTKNNVDQAAAATERMRIAANGNVGIGSNAPASKLHVGAGSGDGLMIGNYNDQLGWNGAGIGPDLSIRFAGYRDVVNNFTGAKIAGIRTNSCCSGLSQGMELAFYTQEGTATGSGDANLTERLRIGNGGNVGIGIAVPVQKLHVVGNARISGLAAGGNVQANASGDLIISNDIPGGDGDYIQNQNASAQSANYWITGTANSQAGYTSTSNPWGTSNSAFFPNGITTAAATNWIYGSTNYIGNAPSNGYGHQFNAASGNSSAWLAIGGGNVGVGTTAPSQKLTVAGNVNKSGSWIVGDAVWGANNFEVHNNSWDGATNGNYGGVVGGHFYAYGGMDIGTGSGWEAGSGQLVAATDIKSPIYYDRDNTGYYVNPNGTSLLNKLRVDGNGTTGGHWGHDPYGYGWGAPYASFRNLEVSSSGNYSNEPAMLRIHQWGSGAAEFWKPQGTNLYLRETPGGGGGWFTRFVVQGKQLVHAGSIPNGWDQADWGSLVSFRRPGSANMASASHVNSQLELVSEGAGTAHIAFHRPGIYGANFGLDNDNWFSTQGWSAGGGYTPIRMGSAVVNGNLTVTGTFPGDNLGNHSATTTLSMNNNVMAGYGSMEPYGVGGNSGQPWHSYRIWQEGGAWNPPFPDLVIRHHTGVKISAEGSYDGVRIYARNGEGQTAQFNENGMYLNNGWFRNYGQTGLHNESYGNHFYGIDANYWASRSNRGIIIRNVANADRGYLYHDDGASFGLLSPNGNWRFRCDNSNSEAYGGGFYAPTSYIPFIYDRDNTGYYLDPNGNTYINAFQNNNTLLGWPGYNGMTQGYGHYIWPGRNDGSGAWWQQSWYLAGNSSYGLYTNTGMYFAGGTYHQNGGSFAGSAYTRDWGDASGTSYGKVYSNWDNQFMGGIAISDDGGFYDRNDAWLRFCGSRGVVWDGADASLIMAFDMNDNGGLHDKQVYTTNANWGYMGTSGNYWYQMWSGSFNNGSRREWKRDITPVRDGLYELVMEDIDKIQPSFYKYNEELDEYQEGMESKYRPNYHLGVIIDESPDYIQDNTFNGIDIYAIATMGLTGVKYNRQEIKEIKEAVGLENGSVRIQDFGTIEMNGNRMHVPFNDKFASKLNADTKPIVTLTSNKLDVQLAVASKDADGFTIIAKGDLDGLVVDYSVFAEVSTRPETSEKSMSPSLLSGLRIDQSIKDKINVYWDARNKEANNFEPNSKAAQVPSETDNVVPHAADPNVIIQGPAENPDEAVKQRAEEAKRNFVEVPEDDPARGGYLPEDSTDDAAKPVEVDPNFWKTDPLVNPDYLKELKNQEIEKQKLDLEEQERLRDSDCATCPSKSTKP